MSWRQWWRRLFPALSQGVWFWGNTDDVLFRLITLGSAGLEKQGFTRYQYGTVHAGMPPMGVTIPTSDQLWKIIAFIRSINPPEANPPQRWSQEGTLLRRMVRSRTASQALELRETTWSPTILGGWDLLAFGRRHE